MLTKLTGRTFLAISLLLLVSTLGLFQSQIIAQNEGAPENGVRLVNLSGVDVKFTLKNKDTDWLSPLITLKPGEREPYLYRNEIRIRQSDGSFSYQPIPLNYVYEIYKNKSGLLEIRQVPKR